MALDTIDKVFLLVNLIKEYFFWHIVGVLLFIVVLLIIAWAASSFSRGGRR